ncbi:MAG TPA: RNA-binding transcriptional accessory protein, partial [Firmicutes bacterium]|nr:RNA-binding transcriptional accessory protein [Bacillota bacterium]
EYYLELKKRKETILKTIDEQGKLTPELEERIMNCNDKNILEDIYLPYKPKKRTRATIAKEKGLEPLAVLIYNQESLDLPREEIISVYIDSEKNVNSIEEALQGAKDIVAEMISEEPELRDFLRSNFKSGGMITSSVKKEWAEKKSKFQDYYNFTEEYEKSPSHRVLAMHRGEKEGVLSMKITVDDGLLISGLERKILKKPDSLFENELRDSISDSYKRLLMPSIENEVLNLKLEEAEEEAIKVFTKNLRNLLLSPPAGSKVIMGIDPGFRTGCKIAVIDEHGNYRESKAIFPHEPQKRLEESENIILDLLKRYNVELVSIGNGTASKETDIFVRNTIKKHNLQVIPIMVSEAGASVYSASPNAVKEFPDLDVTVRGAVSIARRLQDPLAELVKIDPKAIGVGQYQHDVNQRRLKEALDLTVESCVNFVGAELNTASVELLSYVSGINRGIAENIVKYRSLNGSFKNRAELLKVQKLGPKAFEQAAGFLRIRNSENPLDSSSIHPESYKIVEAIAKDHGVKVEELIGNEEKIKKINLNSYVNENAGAMTLKDIIEELKKPGHDPRAEFKSIQFSDSINEITDLKEGMLLTGTVTNVTNFGAFVDIGVHQDALIHISNLSTKFIRDPHTEVAVGDIVKVKVLNIDVELKRISLKRI